MHRKAVFYFCRFLDRGVECWRAPLDRSRACGCLHYQMDFVLRAGLSQSHERKIRRQILADRERHFVTARPRNPMTGKFIKHDRDCICMSCRESRVTSANPHGWPNDD